MKTFYKLGLFLFFLLNFSFSVSAATIDLVRFNNTASYVPGSGVSVIINPNGVFELNNTFKLELSNNGGAFTSPTVLTTLTEFYVPVINGILPAGLAPGNYKLRVSSTFPVLSVETNFFTVISGSGIGIPNFKSGIINDGSTKFNCLTDCSSIQSNNIYGQIDVAANNSTSILNNTELRGTICNPDTNATYQVNLINISNSIVTNLNLNAAAQFSIPSNLPIGTYIIEIEKKISNKISIFSNIFIFQGSATNINNLSSETVCVGNNVQFSIDSTTNGIGRNYMGSKYTIDFGDGSPILTYTHAQLLQILTTPELISHTFNSVSCSFGTSPNIGYYILKLKLFNKGVFNSGGNANYCNQYYENGNGADKRVNTNRAPVADFTLPNKQCINTSITATNTTVLGQYGTASCLTTPRYYWYIKRPSDTDFLAIDSSFNPSWLVGNNLVIPASFVNISGCWQIKLEAQNAGAGCTTTTEMIKTIKIEVLATATFTYTPQSPICPNTQIQFTNTSNITSIPCQEPAYTWTVSPTTGVQFVNPSTALSQSPLILFTQIGTYTVTLTVVNSCGTVVSTPATIVVSGSPTVSFNPSTLTVCSPSPPSYTIDFSQVGTTPTYSAIPFLPTSFAWTVTGTGVTASDYSFIGGTSATSQFPKITFTAYKTYSIQVVVNGNCPGSNQATFTFTLVAPPTMSVQPLLSQTMCQGSTPTTLQATAAGGNGAFSYQWYTNTNASTTSGTAIATATSSSFIPPSTSVGTQYYYCIISQPGIGCSVTSAIATVNIVAAPQIANQPASNSICQGGTLSSLSFSLNGATGTVTYQWYSNTNPSNTGGTSIPLATGSTYSPSSSTVGVFYYYCIITLSTGGCSNITSDFATITVSQLPTITTQPTPTSNLCVGTTLLIPLTISYIGGAGTPTYQWYSNTSNSQIGGTAITGATNNSYTPPSFTLPGVYYYYCKVTLSGAGCGAVTSSVATINVSADPTISAQPLPTQTLCQGATPTSLQVTATGGNGAFSYQWFSNPNATTPSGTAIATATSSTFIPPTTTVGTQYYYCEITQITPGCGVTSAISTVVVNASPSIQNQPVSSTICLGGTPTQMSVTYINGVGTPSYQWYSNTIDNNTTGTIIPGGTSLNYSPPNTPIGTIYYYCIITLPSAGGCSNIVSNTAFVTINGLPTIDTQPLSTQDVCVGATLQTPLTVVHSGGTGTASYQWFSNTSNSPVGGSPITGETNINFTPSIFTTVGTKYFYVVVTLSGSGCGAVSSSVASINVLADPTISAQPLTTQTLCQGTTPTALTVSATGGIGIFTYQWYLNSPLNTLIPGATNNTYIPDTTVTGTTSYYCIVSQTGVGCQVTSNNADVVVVPAPVINNQPQSSSICIGGSPSSLSVTYLNGTGTASYQWYDGTGPITGATNISYSPVLTSTTSYYCIVTFSSGGCTSITSDTALITVEPLPSIDIQPLSTQNICVGGTIAPLSVSYINGAGTPTYQWYSSTSNSTTGGTPVGTNSLNFTPPAFSAVGTYHFYSIVTLSGNGCGIATSNSAEVVVVADPVLTTQPIPTQTICQGITPQSLTVTGSGGIGSFSYQWYSNTPPNSLIPGATSDTYVPDTIITGTTNYYCIASQPGIGCEAISNLSEVIVVPAPLITTQPQNRAVCQGQSVTPLTVAYINGAGNVTYQWFSNTNNSNLGGTSISGANTNSFTPPSISVGTVYYYCEITFSSGGCTLISTNTAEVNIYQYPVISNQNVVACSGDAFNFVPQIGGANIIPTNTQYTWNLISINPLGSVTGATSETTPQNGLNQTLINNTNQVATVTYLVTPIAGICSGNPFTVEVLVYPKPSVVFDLANQTICNETDTSLVTLSSSTPGTISFSWTASVPPGITGAILSGTDTIPVQNLINSTTSPLTIDITAIGTFNYNGSGCNGPSSIYSITVNPTLLSSGTISSYNGYGVSFFGATDGFIDLTVTGGSGVYTYTWTGPNGFTASTEDLNGIAAGTYTVSINDGYCTPTVLTFTLTQPPELLFQEDTSVHVDLLCFGDSNGVLGITITQESVPPYDFQLINSNGIVVNTILSSTALNQSFSGLVADTYSVKIIDANGGVKILNGLIVTQPADIVITPTTTPITCYGANNASITLTVTGGTGPYQAVWDNLATGFYQNNLSAGTYTILVTDSNNCTKPISVFIPEALLFTVNPVVKNISCFGAHDGSINLNFVGGIPAINLVWSDGSTAGTTRNNLGPGTYSVTIIDGTPCTIFRTFTIVEPQPLVVTASLTNALDCLNPNSGAINLIVSGGTPAYSYNWSNGSTTEDLLSITSGNYQIVVTDLNGCTNTKQYSILRPDPIQISVSTQTTFDCETHYVNQSFVANVVGGVPAYQLQWSSGTISGINNEIMQTNVNGIVTLTVTDNIGCQSNYTVNVDTPVLGFTSFEPVSYGYSTYGIYSIGDPIQFQSTVTGDYVSILWDFGDGTFSTELNPYHTYSIPKDYVVKQTVTYPFGCVYIQTISLIVENGYLLVVPTAFTPNQDTLNDKYRPVTKRLKNITLDIYDSWGSLIYSEKGDVITGWDGKIRGYDAENGNYYSKVSAETFYGTIINQNQTLVIIK